MWKNVSQIDSWVFATDFVVGNDGLFWCLWNGGAECISLSRNKRFRFALSRFLCIEAAGTNGEKVVALLGEEGGLACFSLGGSEIVVLEKTLPKHVLAISPYRHECFNFVQCDGCGAPTYLYYFSCPDAAIGINEKYAVLVDACHGFMKIGSGGKVFGGIGIPLMYESVPLVGNVAVGCTSGNITVIITREGIISFESAGGMQDNLLALVKEEQKMVYIVDLNALTWGAFPLTDEITRGVERVFVCPSGGKYYIICVEEARTSQNDYLNIWVSEIPKTEQQGVKNLPVRYTVRSLPFAFE